MIKNGSVRKRGQKWYYSFEIGKIDGKRKRIERVCKKATTKVQALQEMAEAIKQYENGGITEKSLDEITVADFAQLWIEKYVKVAVSPTTVKGYSKAINDFAAEYGIYKMKSINRVHAQEFCNKLVNHGYYDKTIKFKMVAIHGAFEYAIANLNLLEYNPITKYKMPKRNFEPEKMHRAYTEHEASQILQYLMKKKLYHHYIACYIAYKTGMREGEIYGLSPEDVDLKNGLIYVRRNLQISDHFQECRYLLKMPKTKSSKRTIVIDEELINELKAFNRYRLENKLKYGEYYKKLYLNEYSEVVERETDKPIEFFVSQENGRFGVSVTLCAALKHAEKDLGFRVTMHSFRHTHATMLIENGLNIKAVQDRLGHSNVSTTLDIYAEATEKSQQQTLDVLKNIKMPTIAEM